MVVWIYEDYYITSSWFVESITQAIDDQEMSGFECGVHRDSFDDEGFDNEVSDYGRDDNRYNNDLNPFPCFVQNWSLKSRVLGDIWLHIGIIIAQKTHMYKLDFISHFKYTFCMSYIIAGLGNPGEEYENTRHNTGRIVLDFIAKQYDAVFEFSKKSEAQVADTKITKEKVTLIEPETFMNLSGKSISYFIKNPKQAEKLIVIYDDFSLPLGKIRISYNRSSGGHNGVESIIQAIKTEAFTRIRIGTAKENAKGHAKLINGEDKIEKFILGKFKDEELKELKKVSKRVMEAIEVLIGEGREKAMSLFN